jgi:hypothetical protein
MRTRGWTDSPQNTPFDFHHWSDMKIQRLQAIAGINIEHNDVIFGAIREQIVIPIGTIAVVLRRIRQSTWQNSKRDERHEINATSYTCWVYSKTDVTPVVNRSTTGRTNFARARSRSFLCSGSRGGSIVCRTANRGVDFASVSTFWRPYEFWHRGNETRSVVADIVQKFLRTESARTQYCIAYDGAAGIKSNSVETMKIVCSTM